MTAVDVLAPFVFVIYIALLGAAYGMQNVSVWYQTLQRPPLSPPPWVFSVVWPILYVLIAVSWSRANYLIGNGFTGINYNVVNALFIVNMVLNFLWSVVFFYAKQMVWGLVVIIAMIITLGFLIYYLRADRACMFLLVPYMLWLLFAAYLNAGMILVNKA